MHCTIFYCRCSVGCRRAIEAVGLGHGFWWCQPVGQLGPTSPRARWVGKKMAEKYEAASRRRSVGPLARRVSTPLSYLTRSFHLPRSEHESSSTPPSLLIPQRLRQPDPDPAARGRRGSHCRVGQDFRRYASASRSGLGFPLCSGNFSPLLLCGDSSIRCD